MSRIYLEFFYRHSIPEMLLWGVMLTAFWTVLSLISTRYLRLTNAWIWINRVVLITAILFILYWTVGRRAGSKQEISLIPFYSFLAAQKQPERYRSIVANILLFIPFGLSMPLVVDSSRLHRPVLVTIISAAALSTIIEALQFFFSLGLCEIDDVIFNTCGAAVGSLAFVIARSIEKLRPDIPI